MAEHRTFGNYTGRFGGTDIVHPKIGQTVEIVAGDFIGAHLVVTALEGYAFGLAYCVYVEAPDGLPIWYWPWDVKIVG